MSLVEMLPDVALSSCTGKDHRPWWCARDSRRVGAVVGPSPTQIEQIGVYNRIRMALGACMCIHRKMKKCLYLLTTKRVANKLKKIMASLI